MAEVKNYDLVIVGGSIAGCILAAKISEKGVNPETRERLKLLCLSRRLCAWPAETWLRTSTPKKTCVQPPVPGVQLRERFCQLVWGRVRPGWNSLVVGSAAYFPFDEDYED